MHDSKRKQSLILFLLFSFGISSFAEVPSPRTFEVRVLNETADCSTSLHFQVEGLISGCWHTHNFYACQMSDGGRRFLIDLDRASEQHELTISATSLMKLLLACPDYQIATKQVRVSAFETEGTWEVELQPLPRQSIQGRVTFGDDDQLLRNGTFEVRYALKKAMPYFGYSDGTLPEVSLGSFTTDDAGEFVAELADIEQDSWIDDDSGPRVWILAVAEQTAGWDERVEGLSLSLQELRARPLRLRFETTPTQDHSHRQ